MPCPSVIFKIIIIIIIYKLTFIIKTCLMDFLVFLIRYIFIYLYLTKDNETKKRKDDEDDE